MADGFITRKGGGVNVNDATATTNDVLQGETFYSGDKDIKTGNIPSKGAETFTPTTSNQTISSGQYLSGTQTILGDSDLQAGNIKNGVSIFGVNGTLESPSLTTPTLTSEGYYIGPQVDGWLYYEGNEYTSLTGGWAITYQSSSTPATLTKEANRMFIRLRYGGSYNFISTNNFMDVTNWASLYVEWEGTDTGTYGTYIGINQNDGTTPEINGTIRDPYFQPLYWADQDDHPDRFTFSKTVDACGVLSGGGSPQANSRLGFFMGAGGASGFLNRDGRVYIYKVGYVLNPKYR